MWLWNLFWILLESLIPFNIFHKVILNFSLYISTLQLSFFVSFQRCKSMNSELTNYHESVARHVQIGAILIAIQRHNFDGRVVEFVCRMFDIAASEEKSVKGKTWSLLFFCELRPSDVMILEETDVTWAVWFCRIINLTNERKWKFLFQS